MEIRNNVSTKFYGIVKNKKFVGIEKSIFNFVLKELNKLESDSIFEDNILKDFI